MSTTAKTGWRPCRKVSLTVARRLTEADWQVWNGIIQTPEGPAPFKVGDYLGRDEIGQFPMKRTTLESEHYRKVADLDDEWATYRPCDVREALQMMVPFTLNGQHGKAGDYKVRRGEKMWIVDRTIFERSYQFLDVE